MATSTDGYGLLKTITLPGTAGGHGDWTTFDPDTQTVWLSQSPDHNVVVIDATTNQIKGVIPGIENGNGIALTPQYAFLSDNQSGDTVIVDKRTLQTVGTVTPVGTGPNGTTYVPSTNQVFVSTDSNDMTVFSATPPFAQVATFRLQPDPSPSGPDVALYVPSKDLLYQPDGVAVDVIDPHKDAVVAVWHPGIQGSSKPLVYDPVTNHFILGTTDNHMLVLDGNTGQTIATIPVQGGVDETTIDVAARLAFAGDKAGVIEMINLDTDQVVGTLPSEVNVHTLTVDPTNHEVFVYRNDSNQVDVFAPVTGGVSVFGGAEGTVFITPKMGSNPVTATATGNDTVISQGTDTIQAGGGADVVYATGAAATVIGGTGSLTFVGGGGNDVFVGGSGSSAIYGGSGSDTFFGGTGPSILVAGSGAGNLLLAGVGNTTLVGGLGKAVLMFGGPGADSLTGSSGGSDTMVGGAGGNSFSLTDGDVAFGGPIKADTFTAGNGTAMITTGGGGAQVNLGGGTLTSFEGSGAVNYNAGKGEGGTTDIVGFTVHDHITLTGGFTAQDASTAFTTATKGSFGTILNLTDGTKINVFGVNLTATQVSVG
jgi:DNA-binding beta-propeller fold protein YncE